ncbi:hypothetical protein SEVIR_2G069600v4 [Setaria viridis]|uniref:Uncharacterized protein n=1 Tax=Setaria viridis TaxID=4556 RepID=A0A4U6VMF5_SETVI|nr:protein CHUP1, chloroplastic-like [Setaria viridis]TKW30911.1 hypothetical protein SEVIR_2G069600v2 [Setaria viridis]
MESNKAEGITNLLLKIVFPLAFPLAGAFICDLITSRANRHSSFTDSSESSFQLDQSLGSICNEEEEEEMESTRRASRRLARTGSACSTAGRLVISELARQASNAEEVMVVEATENSSEAAANKQLQDDQRMAANEIASLKLMVSALEDRACSMEAQFNEYCDMKEQESAYQKMQIMCLGMKLELLESQNQRLEAAAVEIRAAAEEFAAMKGKLDMLQSKFKKITKRSKQDSDAFGEKILALNVKQSQMARRCEEFEQAMEEMKQLTLQLQEQKAAANNENVEVVVERSLRNLSSGRDLVDGLEALRDRWATGMEEMIYLGWITAWLQHDLMLIDDDDDGSTVLGGSTYDGGEDVGAVLGGSAYDDDDDRKRKGVHPPEDEKKKGETMVAAAAPSNEVELCKAGSVSSSGSSSGPRRSVEVEPPASSCLGFAAAGGCSSSSRGGGGGWSIGRPRLLRKLRGWAAAGGKAGDRGGKARCRIAGPCCQK